MSSVLTLTQVESRKCREHDTKSRFASAAGGIVEQPTGEILCMMSFAGDMVDADGVTNIVIAIGTKRLRARFVVCDRISSDCIIGRDLLAAWDATVLVSTGISSALLESKLVGRKQQRRHTYSDAKRKRRNISQQFFAIYLAIGRIDPSRSSSSFELGSTNTQIASPLSTTQSG